MNERALFNAARYLGLKTPKARQENRALLEDAYERMRQAAQPRHLLRRFEARLTDGALLIDGLPPLPSQSLRRIFTGAPQGLALLATLGAPVDFLIRRLMVSEPAMGAAVGACASAYVDEYIDGFLAQEAAALRAQGLRLRPRFSPGYGDVPLSVQRPLLEWLDARRIGVTLTQGFLMLPEKSVSALAPIVSGAEGKEGAPCRIGDGG